jgi:hypothetical protein
MRQRVHTRLWPIRRPANSSARGFAAGIESDVTLPGGELDGPPPGGIGQIPFQIAGCRPDRAE